LNESFGVTNLETTLQKLITGNKMWEEMRERTTDYSEVMRSPITNVDLEFTSSTELISISTALRTIMDNDEEMVIEVQPYTRNSVVKNMDYLVAKSIPTSLIIYKDKMRGYFKYMKKNRMNMKKFHEFLLFQIMKAMDFEMSDTMSVIVYNHILKSSATTLEMTPITDLKKLPKDFNPPESTLFVKPFLQYDEDFEMVMDMIQE